MIDSSRHTKATGETSFYNDAEIEHIIQDLRTLRGDCRYKGFSFLVTSFYKAQVNKHFATTYQALQSWMIHEDT